MNEAETRAEHIAALKAAGWGVVEGSRIHRECPITRGRLEGGSYPGKARRAKALCADYVLVYRNTKLALIEAKAWDQSVTEGVAQAKDYAEKLAIRFCYSANGQGTRYPRQTPRWPGGKRLWPAISQRFTSKQQAFLEFVLSHYVSEGVQELNREKLTPLLKLKYRNAIADAVADLGRPRRNRPPLRRIPKIPLPADVVTAYRMNRVL